MKVDSPLFQKLALLAKEYLLLQEETNPYYIYLMGEEKQYGGVLIIIFGVWNTIAVPFFLRAPLFLKVVLLKITKSSVQSGA